MKDSNGVERMRPVIIIPRKTVTKKDIELLRDNGICVVEATDPSLVRFIEPPPEGYSVQELAAIKLSRYLLGPNNEYSRDRDSIGALYAHFVIQGSPLDSQPIAKVKKAKS